MTAADCAKRFVPNGYPNGLDCTKGRANGEAHPHENQYVGTVGTPSDPSADMIHDVVRVSPRARGHEARPYSECRPSGERSEIRTEKLKAPQRICRLFPRNRRSAFARSWGRERNFRNLLISGHIVALMVARKPARKSPQGPPKNSSILLIPHVVADTLPARAGDLQLPESLIGSAPHLLGDRDVICVCLDFKAHRGFAGSPKGRRQNSSRASLGRAPSC